MNRAYDFSPGSLLSSVARWCMDNPGCLLRLSIEQVKKAGVGEAERLAEMSGLTLVKSATHWAYSTGQRASSDPLPVSLSGMHPGDRLRLMAGLPLTGGGR